MSYLQKTKHITISADIPSVLSPQSVKTAVQNHPFMLNLSPIVTSHTPIDLSNPSSPTDVKIPNEPAFTSARWYKVSETVPVIGNINFLAAFKNTSEGQESLVHAPGGLRMHVRYFIESGEKVDATLSESIDPPSRTPTSQAQPERNAASEPDAPVVSITPATPIPQSDASRATTGNDSLDATNINTDESFSTSRRLQQSEAGAAATQREKDWAFLGDHGHGNVLREECTLQANMFLMPFITVNFESVHRRMQARLFEILANGEGPVESS